jgi:hypothetical protein
MLGGVPLLSEAVHHTSARLEMDRAKEVQGRFAEPSTLDASLVFENCLFQRGPLKLANQS